MSDQPSFLDSDRVADAATRARTTDPHTSHEAAREVAASITTVQAAVLGVLRNTGPRPDHEWIAAFKLQRPDLRRVSDSSLRSRRAELVTAGKVKACPDLDARTPRGRRAIVWALA